MSEEKFYDCIFNKYPNNKVSYIDCIIVFHKFNLTYLYIIYHTFN